MSIPMSALGTLGLVAVTAFSGQRAKSDRQTTARMRRTIQKTVQVDYLLYLPEAYEANDAEWPLLLFLHGAGERGSDLERVKRHGPPKMIEHGHDFPFVIVSPQCPERQWWDIEALNALLDEIIEKYRIDQDRVYITGLSMGGYGTWWLACAYPHRFAAVAPICGGGDPEKAPMMKDIPTWAFHGALDETVKLAESKIMVDALKAAGGDVRFTVYPDAAHVGAWQNAYADPKLWEWLSSQRRGE